jgi:hypothetical protein
MYQLLCGVDELCSLRLFFFWGGDTKHSFGVLM